MDSATGYCKGCYRTIDEIIAWGQADESLKQAVWRRLEQRHIQLNFLEAGYNAAFTEAL
jgi:uncharacterized protein